MGGMQAGHGSAIPVTITSVGYGTQVILYGQTQTYTATLTVPAGNPVPQGQLQFQNASTTISTAQLASTGTASNNGTTLVRAHPRPDQAVKVQGAPALALIMAPP